ncbi:hypothetical protein WG906_07945 [Pedobacter sp. P351]|uniref:hypothetical protein n=1 Tax=Pedobacter superstes TaxID=3133441 RepID=UPI0030AB2FA2
MNILITAAATAHSYKLQRSLNNVDTVFLADSEDLPQVMLKDKKFVKIPLGDSPSFAHLLLTICLDNSIEKVFPLRTAEVFALADSRQLFDEYGIRVIVPVRARIASLLNKGIKGEIVINEDAEKVEFPDRGIFLKDGSSSEVQLFTVD